MDTKRFNAFISYRHHPVDSAVAEEIQRRLERFHIPGPIRKKYGIQKIQRIFRDQSELEMTSNLSKEIDDALMQSDFLIVVLSPRYLESKWCLHEIDVFLQYHPKDHVLTVLAEGEPPGVFPPQLRYDTEKVYMADGTVRQARVEIEPLACDYRGKFKEANKTELPRLCAAIIGCTYDELVMRQQQYKRKRSTLITSALLTLAAGIVGYLLYSNAVIQRHYRNTLISESKVLAVRSLEKQEAKDRFGALTDALLALPSDTLDRPVTSEAVYALTKATGVYKLPFQTNQTRIYDGEEEYISFLFSPDERFLICLDTSSTITVYDIDSGIQVSTFGVHASEEGAELIASSKGQLISVYEGLITAYDLQGRIKWEQEVVYPMGSRLHESPDGQYIGCADTYAVQVMNSSDGSPIASFPLPDSIQGYVRDFAWSMDAKTIAVQIRYDDGSDQFGFFDFESGAFSLAEESVQFLDAFFFTPANQLIVAANASEEISFISNAAEEYRHEANMSLLLYSEKGELLSSLTIPYAAIHYGWQCKVIESSDNEILLSFSSILIRLNMATGEEVWRKDLGESIISIITAAKDSIEVLTAEGKRGTLRVNSDDVYFKKEFPENARKVMILEGAAPSLNRFFLMKDGNILLFENEYDDALLIFEGEGFLSIPENTVTDGEHLLMKIENQLMGYDLETKEQLYVKEYPRYDVIRMLGCIESKDQAVCLLINMNTGTMSVALVDLPTGEQKELYPLSITDYYYDSGILDIYAQRAQGTSAISVKRQLLEAQYLSPMALALEGNKLYYHGYQEPNTLYVLDLLSGDEEKVKTDLKEGRSLLSGSYEGSLSNLVISPEGEKIFAVVSETGRDLRGAMIDPKTGETDILSESESSSELIGAWSKDGQYLAVATAQGIQIYQKDGTLRNQILYSGSKVLAMEWLTDGTLVACYPGGTMVHYQRTGEVLHEALLSYGALEYVMTQSFRFEEKNGMLQVFCQNTLEMIDLKDFGYRPAVSCMENVIGYLPSSNEVVVYTYDPNQSNGRFYLGSIPIYTLDELIQKARVLLKQ